MLFSPLTSKIFGGLAIAAIAFHVVDEIGDNRAMNAKVAELNKANAKVTDLRGLVAQRDAALVQCNKGVTDAAEVADKVSKAAVTAVEQVKRAGRENVSRTVTRIEQAPAATCQDAEAILRGEAG